MGARKARGATLIAAVRRLCRRLLCRHTHGRLRYIEWDGTAVYVCHACGKNIRKGL